MFRAICSKVCLECGLCRRSGGPFGCHEYAGIGGQKVWARRRLDEHFHFLRTTCSERAALKVHCLAFREVRCKYVCDGKRVDEVNEVDRIARLLDQMQKLGRSEPAELAPANIHLLIERAIRSLRAANRAMPSTIRSARRPARTATCCAGSMMAMPCPDRPQSMWMKARPNPPCQAAPASP